MAVSHLCSAQLRVGFLAFKWLLLKNEAVADSVTTPALSLSSNTSISHSHIKEQNRVVAIAAAVLCKPLLHHNRQKSYFCIHVPHHSGLFDGTDHCQDAEALAKHTAWLENSLKAYGILHSVEMHVKKGFVHVCPVFWACMIFNWDNLITIDQLIIFN